MTTATVNNKNKAALKKKSYILFQAKSFSGRSIADRYRRKYQVYHLSERFSPESTMTHSLCGYLEFINWATKFEIITLDELANYRNVCLDCLMEVDAIMAAEKAYHRAKRKGNERKKEVKRKKI